MAKSNFEPVMVEIFAHEGGYVDHPRDPGGATNMGITHLTLAAARGVERVSKAEVKAMTKAEAKQIYRARYWDKLLCDHLPYGHDLVAMDGGVNSGPRRGAKWLQRGVGVKADGKIGPKTIDACRSAGVGSIARACQARMGFLQGLRHWDAFGKGWSRRVARVEAKATTMWLSAAQGRTAARVAAEQAAEAATPRAQDERRAGAAQAASTGAAGAGGAAGVPWQPELVVGIALLAIVAAALLALRAYRRARYEEDRATAYLEAAKELEQ